MDHCIRCASSIKRSTCIGLIVAHKLLLHAITNHLYLLVTMGHKYLINSTLPTPLDLECDDQQSPSLAPCGHSTMHGIGVKIFFFLDNHRGEELVRTN